MGKISQFEFLVMTEKNVFAYKLFLPLNISDFIFYVKIGIPPSLEKSSPSFPATLLQKLGFCQAPLPFLKIWLEAQLPCRKEGVGEVHTMTGIKRHNSSTLFFAETLYAFRKVAYQSTNLVKFQLSSRKSEMLHCGGLLL